MKKIKPFLFVVASIFVFIACQKEYSLETGNAGALASGTLKDTTGNCLPRVVSGVYTTDSALNDNDFVTIQVNITSPGIYKISTDTQNGFYFKDSGFIADTGIHTIKLKGTGQPIVGKTTDFEVSFGLSVCVFSVDVVQGTGPSNATFTLAGTPGNCTNAVVQGTYTTGTQLSSSNKVIISVNVLTTGTYLINTGNVKGMAFVGTGTFTTTGLQTVTLQGGGTPTTAGNNTIPITAGSSTCSFTVAVTQGSGGSGNPNLLDSAWSFNQGNTFYHGPVFYASDTTNPAFGYGVAVAGATSATGDTTMTIAVIFSNGTITPGVYNTNTFAAFSFDDYLHLDANGKPTNIYQADYTVANANTAITISSYDPATKLIIGSFTGTAKNKAGTIVPITSGKFKAQLN